MDEDDRVLRFTDLPKTPRAAELDDVMRQVSEQLNEQWTAVRMNGYWLIYHEKDGKKDLHQSRKRFINALSEATNANIVNAISL
jgi:hypothetical protein